MIWPEFVYPIADMALRLRSIALATRHPLHRHEGLRPFFVVGSGRCGSTLLRRILQAGGEVHIPPEAYKVGPAVRFFRRQEDRDWNFLVRNVLSMFEYHPKFERWKVSLRPVYFALAELPPERRSLAMILDAFYRHHGRQQGATFTRWADKTPLNSYCLKEVLATFPDVRFVHLLRDGVDVVQSRLAAGFERTVEAAAKRWQSAVTAVDAFARRHPSICTEVRYERLVGDPEPTVRELCTFLGLTFRDEMLVSTRPGERMHDVTALPHHTNVLKPISGESVGKGRRDLPAEDRMALQRLIGADLERLGYDPVV